MLQNKFFEIIYNQSKDGVLIIENNKFTDCNESIVKMLGYKNKIEFLNIHPSQLSPKFQADGKDSYTKAQEMISETIKNGYHQFEWIYTKANGDNFWVDVVLTKIEIEDGYIIHTVWRDIDKFKRLELTEYKRLKLMEIESKSAAIGRVTSMLAHQWRQPLSLINSITSNIYQNLDDTNVKLKNEILKIEDITSSLSKSISNINSFYSIANTKHVSIKNALEESINILFPSFSNANKPKFIINEIDKLDINGYSYGLEQCLITLFSNALFIFKEREIKVPKITITLYKNNNFNYIDIEDNGGGINNDIINKVFDIFTTNKDTNLNRGYGLHIAKDIMQTNLNGDISVINTSLGAKFTLSYNII